MEHKCPCRSFFILSIVILLIFILHYHDLFISVSPRTQVLVFFFSYYCSTIISFLLASFYMVTSAPFSPFFILHSHCSIILFFFLYSCHKAILTFLRSPFLLQNYFLLYEFCILTAESPCPFSTLHSHYSNILSFVLCSQVE